MFCFFHKTNFKITLKKITIKKSGDLVYIDFYAKSFLRRMIRIIIGFLLNVGIKKYKPADVKLIFKNKLKFSPVAAPPHGLFLY